MDELTGLLYKRKVLSKSAKNKVDPRYLPPSSESAKYHILRVYLQIQEWCGNCLDPGDYGFSLNNGKFEPVIYTWPLAPVYLLKTISCNCQKTNCKSGNCSCKSYQLYCTLLCGCGESCINIAPDEDKDTDTNDI